MIGQRLRPERIDLVDGRRHARALRIGVLLQQRLADAKRDNPGGERDAGHKFPLMAEIHLQSSPERSSRSDRSRCGRVLNCCHYRTTNGTCKGT